MMKMGAIFLVVCLMSFNANAGLLSKKVDTSKIEIFMGNDKPKKRFKVLGFLKTEQNSAVFGLVKGKEPITALKIKAVKLGADAIVKVSCGSKTHTEGSGVITGNQNGDYGSVYGESSVDSHEVPVCIGYAVKWE